LGNSLTFPITSYSCITFVPIGSASSINPKSRIPTASSNKIFVAKFLEIELASQGKTKTEALKNLKESLDLYLEDEPKKISFPSIN